jgi:hypothetical protein
MAVRPFPGQPRESRTPTLEALYEAFPNAPFNLEIKGHHSGIEETVSGQIEAAGATERTPCCLRQSGHYFALPQSQQGKEGKVGTASSTVELDFALFG